MPRGNLEPKSRIGILQANSGSNSSAIGRAYIRALRIPMWALRYVYYPTVNIPIALNMKLVLQRQVQQVLLKEPRFLRDETPEV